MMEITFWLFTGIGIVIFNRGTLGLTCYDCIEPCDEDDLNICGGLYCARVKALNVTLQYVILHTCLDSIHLIDNVTLEVNKCAPLDDLDPLWPESIAIQSKTGINLSEYSHGVINICDESDTYCNETKCDFDIYDVPSNAVVKASHFEAIILIIIASFMIY